MDLVCIPVGCAGTLLSHTATELATALSTYLPGNDRKTRSQSREGNPPVDRQAFAHDKTSAIRLLEQLSKLAAQRLDAILSHRSAELSRLGPNDPPPYPPRRRGDPSATIIK